MASYLCKTKPKLSFSTSNFVKFSRSNQFSFTKSLYSNRYTKCINARTYSTEENNYTKAYKFSIGPTREKFWEKEAEKLHWEKKWDDILDTEASSPASLWFPGGLLNICYNALDVNIMNGRGDQKAIIYDSPLTNTKTSITYSQLLAEVEKFAGVLTKYGCLYDGKTSKTVLIYMPNSIEAVITMLACARIGAPHAVVFGGFAATELANRIRHCRPHVIVASSCGVEPKGIIDYKPLLNEALDIVGPSAHPKKCIIFQRDQCHAELNESMDVNWKDEMSSASSIPAIPVSSNHPLYILYTSGTTGDPKGLVRDTAGYAVALNWSMKNIFDIKGGDIFWAASDVGWVVGHSYIVYGPLLQGATSVIFEGKPVGTPDAGAYWRVISEYKIKSLFCAPTSFRAIKRDDPDASLLRDYDMREFQSLFLAGERADPDTVKWAMDHLDRPVIDNYWQTETGWPIVSNFMNLEKFKIKLGSATKPVPGYDISILDDEGHPVPHNTLGNICIKRPLPPGCFVQLWRSEKPLVESSYFHDHPEYYHTGDSGYVDEDGYVFVMSRTGDIINVAGHRLSTGALEEIICSNPHVAECAVIGIFDEVKGQVPLGFVLLKSNVTVDHSVVIQQIIQSVRKNFGAVAFFRNAIVVDKLPKTRSGKILRGIIQKIVEGAPFKYPPTIEDVSAIDHINAKLLENGYKPHPQL